MAINSGRYAADGSWRVSVVDGNSHVGVFAADGSLNVKIASGTDRGIYHWASGAILVTVRAVPGASIYAADGSLYVSESPYVHGSRFVTAVSGSFGGGDPGEGMEFNTVENTQYIVLLEDYE